MNRQFYALLLLAASVYFSTVITASEAGILTPQTAPGEVSVPIGEINLGSVDLPRRVMADGQTLASGTYNIRVTATSADPEVPGQLSVLERWVEFRQGDELRGREVVSIVPQSEIDSVAKSAPPTNGTSRIEMLRENDYLRVWVNQDNTHYLIHLVAG